MDLSQLPKVDRLLRISALQTSQTSLGRRALTVLVRQVLDEIRHEVRDGGPVPDEAVIIERVTARAQVRLRSGLRRIINATGVILHTNLGRAPLPEVSRKKVTELLAGYCNVEFDAELGVRARRGAAVEAKLAELVGAEDALVVNNNAAAVMLALTTIAAGREVIVSRGELVEIGGGFRVPEVLSRSGARLVEVGTTNRTRAEDYERAINERTGAVLRVHPSNFRITGFTERPALAELVRVAHARGLPLIKDLGGGLMCELPPTVADAAGEHKEPLVELCVRAGVDLVCFSLDKLFGGPQGGVVVGKRAAVARLRSDAMARALRVDKLTLAALEPVVDAWARGENSEVPVHRMLHFDAQEVRKRALAWKQALGELGSGTEVIATEAAVGGGTLAEVPVPSYGLALAGLNIEGTMTALRGSEPPVIARVVAGTVVLDARTVQPDEDGALVSAVRQVLERAERSEQ